MAAYLCLLLFDIDSNRNPIAYALLQSLSITPALALWVPVIYLIFVVFSHSLPYASVIIIAFCAVLLIPSFQLIRTFSKWAMMVISILLIITGFVLAHLHSGFSKNHPLQTFLTYTFDVNTNKAYWISEQEAPDLWMRQYIHSETRTDFEWIPGVIRKMWNGEAPAIRVKTGEVRILKDTIIDNKRNLSLIIRADSATNSIDMTVLNGWNIRKINNREMSGIERLTFWSMPTQGIELQIQGPLNNKAILKLIERKIGLPFALIKKELPDDVIYGPGWLCNSTQIRKTVILQ